MVVNNDLYSVQEALSGLVRCYHSELTRILVARTHNEQDAADIRQEAYARLMQYGGRYTEEQLRRMLFRIAGNLLADHWRWNRIHETDALSDTHLLVPDGQPAHERALLSQQRLALLQEVIKSMPPKRRKVFILIRIEGLSRGEVAKRCGISMKMVDKHLGLGMEECRAALAQVGKSPSKPLYSLS